MIKTPQFWLEKSWLSSILLPFSWLYRIGFFCKKLLARKWRGDIRVICVGNIIAGGAGKTPVALAIGDFFLKHNVKFCYLTRGYKGSNSYPQIIDHSALNDADNQKYGDEAMILAKKALTCISKNRIAGYKEIINQGCQVDFIIMDDGLQNFQLHHDYKILVIDSKIGFGNQMILPSGPMRQSLESIIDEINYCIIIGNKNVKLEQQILRYRQYLKIIYARIVVKNSAQFSQKRLLAFCGIAYPQKFYDLMETKGLNVIKTVNYHDHYRYSSKELDDLIQDAKSLNCEIITTLKDWIKFPSIYQQQISYLDIDLEFDDNNFLTEILKK